MCLTMLLITSFLVFTWKCSCVNLHRLSIESVNQYANITSLSINFILKNITASDVRVIGTRSQFEDNFITLNKWAEIPVTLININRQHLVQLRIPAFAVIVLHLDKSVHEIKNLTTFWINARKNKLILVTNDCEAMSSIVKFVALFWSMKMLNFLILDSCNGRTEVYTYFPYGNNYCKIYNETNIIKLGSLHYESSIKDTLFTSEYTHNTNKFSMNPLSILPFFPDKIPLDLNKCVIKTTASLWPPHVIDLSSVDEAGVEVDFMKTMEKQMNCNITILTVSMKELGFKYGANEEHVGNIETMKNEECFDLSFGGVPLHENIIRDFDTTDGYMQNSLTFIVPRANIRPSSTILWILFEKHFSLLIVILGLIVILSITVHCMIKFSFQPKQTTKSHHFSINEIYGTFLRLLIETSTPVLPENKIIQWIYGTWFAACLIISCYFNTILVSYFTTPGHFEQIKTVQDIIDSKIPIAMDHSITPLVTARYGTSYFATRNVNSTMPIGVKLASMGEAATFTDIMRAQHMSAQWVSRTGESSIYYIKEYPLRFWISTAIFRGNPLKERIADIASKMIQSGFWDFQVTRYYNRRLIRTMIRQHLMVYNYQHHINNTLLINQFNKEFIDSLSMLSGDDEMEKLLMKTSEEDIIARFVRGDKTLVTWDHLSTVFRLWGFGMGTGLFVFLYEFLRFKCCKLIRVVKRFIPAR